MKRIATALTVLVLFAVPAHAEHVALVGLGFLGYKYEAESLDRDLFGLGVDYLNFGEDNNLFFGASLAIFEDVEPFYLHEARTFYSVSVGYDLEDNLFLPYVTLMHSRFKDLYETSSVTSLGLGTYIGIPKLRGYTALYGIGADDQSFVVGAYYRYNALIRNDMVLGVSYETPIDDPFDNSRTLNLRIGFTF